MGHTWREMDTAGAAIHDDKIDRMLRLREAFKDVPMSEFTVGELQLVMRLMGLYYNEAGQGELHEGDFAMLEAKLAILKK